MKKELPNLRAAAARRASSVRSSYVIPQAASVATSAKSAGFL
jgi:hypothetical protein